jgi:hypothetical protein
VAAPDGGLIARSVAGFMARSTARFIVRSAVSFIVFIIRLAADVDVRGPPGR